MPLTVSDKYSHVYRLPTQGARNSVLSPQGPFLGVVLKSKLQPPNCNVKHLKSV